MAKKALKRKKPLKKKVLSPLPSTIIRKSRIKSVPQPEVFIDCCELPFHYNRTKVTLIAKDPSSVYAYWEITPSSIQKAKLNLKRNFNKSVQTIRIFDVTGIDFNGRNAVRQFDLPIDPLMHSRYIVLPNEKATVCAELGFKTPSGVFYSLARSNIVATPSSEASDRLEITWAKVLHEQGAKPCVVNPDCSPAPVHFHTGQTPKDFWTTDQNSKDSMAFREETPTKPSTFQGAPQDCATRRATQENEIPSPFKTMQPGGIDDGDSMASNSGNVPDFDIAAEINKREIASSFTAPNFSADEKSYFSADMQSGSSDITIKADEHKRGFFFQVDAELIVFGRTEPGAKVTIDGQEIELRDDGTFTRRLALPDGEFPLDFSAEKADGCDKKRMTLSVRRFTSVHM